MTKQYRVIYSPAALEDLKAIYSYITYELLASQAAQNQIGRIRREIRSLDLFPERYPLVEWEPWASMKMHKVPVNNYVIYYLIDNDKRLVTITRIFYGGRDVEHIIQESDN